MIYINFGLFQVTSQHPYAEDFVGKPNVRTVNIDYLAVVEDAVKQALNDLDNGKVLWEWLGGVNH